MALKAVNFRISADLEGSCGLETLKKLVFHLIF
jgi:hypothetical protein